MFGFVHLIHAPILILFPFMVNNFITDILYIIYFLFIMFLYTFINGECPISYMYKLSIDKNYIAGNISYPEMYFIFNEKNTEYYFGITTTFYIASLSLVVFRTKTFYCIIFTNIVILVYLFFIHNNIYFEIVQEITKYVTFFTMFYLMGFLMQINVV